MGSIRHHTSFQTTKMIDGKEFRMYVHAESAYPRGHEMYKHDQGRTHLPFEYNTKSQAESAAERLRSSGWKARVHKTAIEDLGPYIIFIRKTN